MAIKRHKKDGRVYLSEYKSIRKGKEVESVFVRYLGPEDKITKKPKIPRRVMDRINLSNTHRAGDVSLLWQIAQNIDLINTIDRFCCGESDISGPSPGKLLTIWAINRVIDPESCTQLRHWVPTTVLPEKCDIEPEAFTKNAFLSALDFICYRDTATNDIVDHTRLIDESLYQTWRKINPLPPGKNETVAYDLTSILFFGATCPIAELGHNANHLNRKQINLALLVSDYDKFPLMHFVYNGGRKDSDTMKNLIANLNDSELNPGTLIFDRGNVSGEIVNDIEKSKWKIICGLPKTTNAVKELIEETDINIDPITYAHKSRTGHLYAVNKNKNVYGKLRNLVVYINPSKRVVNMDHRNEELSFIGNELDRLSEKGENWSEKRLHKEIEKAVGTMKQYFQTTVKRKGSGPRIEWHFIKSKLKKTENTEGKWVLLATDGSLKAKDVVQKYIEKDYIEKVFRTIKGIEEIEPVRHRLEQRVRAYVFLCVLAYRLSAILQWKLKNALPKENSWESADNLLSRLARVEKIDVGFGKETKTTFLNLSKKDKDMLKKIGMENLFKEKMKINM